MSEAETTVNVSDYKPTPEEQKLITKWTQRFGVADRFREPYEAKNLRMWKLYRAYRDKLNYAYKTNLMPPVGFEIVETIKPRLSAAKMRTRIFPINKDDVGSSAIEEWDSLITYDFEIMNLEEKKVDYIDSMLKYGNGYAQLFWKDGEDGGDPGMEIIDNWLLYFDPNASNRLKDSEWEIKQAFKRKSKILKDEKKRDVREEEVDEDYEGDDAEEVEDEETGEVKRVKKVHGIYKNLEYVEDEKIADDPRAERLEIETLKMGQIDGGTQRSSDDTQVANSDPKAETKSVEIWECYDHDTDEIITIMNRKVVVRQEANPYEDIEEGRMIIDLPCIRVPWSAFAMSILEPVETIIHEIADSRNQAMDNIVFNLDPIRKIRKESGLTADDLVNAPGAVWELQNADDVVIERGTGIDNSWVEKDNLLRREIQTSLALSEYVRGLPSSSSEPSSKVELLLTQTQIRFSQMVRQFETAMTDIVNILIQMNQKFLPEQKSYRILGDDVDFKEFTNESKEVRVDARVEIEPKPEKGPEKRKEEVMELYEIFVTGDQPDPQDPEAVKAWQKKKREMQKMVLDEYDKSQYEEVLLGLETMEDVDHDKNEADEDNAVGTTTLQEPAPLAQRANLQPIPPIEPDGAVPQGAPPAGLLQSLLGRLRR